MFKIFIKAAYVGINKTYWNEMHGETVKFSKLSVMIYEYGETVIHLNSQIYKQLYIWNQILLCNLNLLYI